ncbi:hypoxanthine-guanine phosphoribosyltransferase [Trypanosoma grayi]|uniref:hypoxanthine-guanine phosphoribosyltransferase n=1 Tax=Trypanosoma grayi TaxID=71804 RepID=UPI0004F46154|nr:hypoxanthine-guanine phosphoribosyltransferase [Trypanosoma grayi]KEG10341.1 hypoxanthine-guanine phosphoribosyltransferase [Trypanosoma grayi]
MGRKYDFAESVLLTQEDLQARMRAVAQRIADDYRDKDLRPITNPLVLVCVLKGSFMFTADLCRALFDMNVPTCVEFICVTSYCGGIASTGQVRMLLDTRQSIEGKHVMIVEDIVDTALTMEYLYNMYKARKPASMKTVVMLDKPEGRRVPFNADYVVARIPHVFVIGYGLDYEDCYREVRDVVVLHPKVYRDREPEQQGQKGKEPEAGRVESKL